MRPRPSFRSASWVATTAILDLFAFAPSAPGQPPDPAPGPPRPVVADREGATPPSPDTTGPQFRVLISDVPLRRAAESALRSALSRVDGNGCRGLLTEFVDQRGQPLASRLDALQLSFREFLHIVVFADGRKYRACEEPAAVTTPGSRVVYLCPGFKKESRNDAWVAILHEALHALGLGENPPTPAFISNRVRALCR